MLYCVLLTENGRVIPRTTVYQITNLELWMTKGREQCRHCLLVHNTRQRQAAASRKGSTSWMEMNALQMNCYIRQSNPEMLTPDVFNDSFLQKEISNAWFPRSAPRRGKRFEECQPLRHRAFKAARVKAIQKLSRFTTFEKVISFGTSCLAPFRTSRGRLPH